MESWSECDFTPTVGHSNDLILSALLIIVGGQESDMTVQRPITGD